MKTTQTKPRAEWIDRYDLERAYQDHNPGGHYFDPDTLRWFNARVSELALRSPSGVVFFTESTRNDLGRSRGHVEPRRYSVCAMPPVKGAGIEKPHGFEAFASRSGAHASMVRLAARNLPPQYFLGSLQLAAKEAVAAAEGWEAAGGALTTEVDQHRRNCETWAKSAGCRVTWPHFRPSLILPRHRREVPFAEWAPVVAELFPKD